MTYTRPEVVVLGSASALIESQSKSTQAGDGNHTAPAYDLDE